MALLSAGLLDTGVVDLPDTQIVQPDFTGIHAVPAGADFQQVEIVILKPFVQNGIIVIDNAWVEAQAQDASGQLSVLTAHAILTGTSFFNGAGGHYIRGLQLQVPPQNRFPLLAAAAGGVLPYVFDFNPVREDIIAVPGDNIEVHFTIVYHNNDAANPHSFQQFSTVVFREARRVSQ